MYKTTTGKRRLNALIPSKIYERMNRDVEEYGVNKSSIVSTALVEYYKSIDRKLEHENDAD